MANRHKGDLDIEVEGKTWTLRLDFNALCEFEDRTGEKAPDFMDRLEKMDVAFKDVRLLMLCALQAHQPDATVTDAGMVMQADGTALTRALDLAFPSGDQVDPAGDADGNAPEKKPAAA